MNISIFDSEVSEIEFNNKFYNLQSYIFIADTVYIFANTEWANLFHLDLVPFTDEMVLEVAKHVFKKDAISIKVIEDIEKDFLLVKSMKNINRKNKKVLLAIGAIKSEINNTIATLRLCHLKFLEIIKLENLNKFFDENIWQVPFSFVVADPKKEDVFIQPICQKMLQRDNLFGFDEKLEEYFTHTMLDAPETTDFDFIKIPFGEIPITIGLTYNQIKYTRNDLQPALLPFNAHLKELSDELIGIKFLPENMAKIKQLCNEKLNQHIAPVQQSLNDSLYLVHLRNQSAENTNSKLFLGIASAETIMDYYKKAKLVQPYVISEIKQRLQRHFDLKSSCIFAYLKQHPSNREEPIKNEPEK